MVIIYALYEGEITKTSTCKEAGKPGKTGAIKGGIIMGMVVQHNMSAMNANRNLGVTAGNLAKSTEKLSSGYKINRAGDNAAGLAISEKMRGQIRGLDQASSNAEDGISLIQTAEGALQESQNIIQRMRELAVQAASDTNTDDDREQIQSEITQLTQEVDRIGNTTEFNTKKLLDGSIAGATSFNSGKASAEGTFTNGIVSVEFTSAGGDDFKNAMRTAVDDVIRIEFVSTDADSGQFSYKVRSLSENYSTLDGSAGDPDAADLAVIGNGSVQKQDGEQGVGVCSKDGQTTYDTTLSIGDGDDDTEKVITISNVAYSEQEETDLKKYGSDKLAEDGAGDIKFTIKNADKIKAGDVIIINLQKATATEQTGEDALRLQVGANGAQEVDVSIASMKAKDLGITQTASGKEGEALDVTNQSSASMAVEAYDNALQTVSNERSKLGAKQNRLEHTINNLDTSSENLQSAESSLRDTDMAEEMTRYSKNNILQQAGQSMLAQANQSTQGVLNLLG